MLNNRLIKMYGLRHKHIRIEDQQHNLKINIIIEVDFCKKENISLTPIELFSVVACFCKKLLKIMCFYKQINYLAK